jgi:RNA polymerase sigma-70 factor (ECF subfamily)
MSHAAEFDDLVETTHRALRSHIATLGVPLEDVDDIAQEVYIEHFGHPERLPPDVDVLGWLKGIARNRCLHHFRSLGARRRQAAALCQVLAERPDPAPASDGQAAALLQCLEKLPERQRAIIDWFYRDSLASEDIAKRLGAPASSVRMLIHRVREALRDCIRRSLARGGT